MRFWRSLTIVLGLLSAGTTSVRASELTKESLAEIKKNVDAEKAVLVDVRERSEWDAGHIDGAYSIPLSELKADPANISRRLPKSKILYTHCVVGKRSVTAGDILEEHGFKVRPIKPGYKELLRAGFKKAS